MNKIMMTLLTTSAITLASAANAADAEVKSKTEYKKNGGYESTRTSEKTNAAGTAMTSESEVDVDIDSKGRMDKTTKTEKKTDPRGLMNAKKNTTETDIEEKERGGYRQVTTRKALDADGTDVTYKTTTDVDVDRDGNVTSTATTEKTVNPKGMMNEKTTSSKTKMVNGKIVEQKKDVD